MLLLDEPTRGVDVGAKAEIYKLIEEARKEGMAILVASSELEELAGICHRIVVMRMGRITAEFDRSEFSKERIIAAAAIDQVEAARWRTSAEPEVVLVATDDDHAGSGPLVVCWRVLLTRRRSESSSR